jgi:hypothetical protein
MKRKSVFLVVGTALIGFGALAWLAITVYQQGSRVRSLEASLSSPAAVVSPVSTASPSASVVPTLSPASASSLSPIPSPSASPNPDLGPGANPVYSGLAWVADSLGHTWVRTSASPDPGYQPVTVAGQSNVTFRAVGANFYNSLMEYAYTVITANQLTNETVLCGWRGQDCSWTVPLAPQTIGIRVYVRLIGAPHRLSGTGAFDSRDDWTELPFQVA